MREERGEPSSIPVNLRSNLGSCSPPPLCVKPYRPPLTLLPSPTSALSSSSPAGTCRGAQGCTRVGGSVCSRRGVCQGVPRRLQGCESGIAMADWSWICITAWTWTRGTPHTWTIPAHGPHRGGVHREFMLGRVAAGGTIACISMMIRCHAGCPQLKKAVDTELTSERRHTTVNLTKPRTSIP
jgi:hypothetical protein